MFLLEMKNKRRNSIRCTFVASLLLAPLLLVGFLSGASAFHSVRVRPHRDVTRNVGNSIKHKHMPQRAWPKFHTKHSDLIASQSRPPLSPRLALSPSGVSEWPAVAQMGVFVGTYAGLAGGTLVGCSLLDTFSRSVVGLERWRTSFIDTALPLLLGMFFASAGVSHFVAAEAFEAIYPPPGTWGFWFIPGSAAFHVAWTGVVEGLGGAGLLVGGVQNLLRSEEQEEDISLKFVSPAAALTLFLLTIIVTPANIYMFTHGATMGPDMPPLDISFHVIRFGVQVVFLSLLLTLAKDSFFFAWGDELD